MIHQEQQGRSWKWHKNYACSDKRIIHGVSNRNNHMLILILGNAIMSKNYQVLYLYLFGIFSQISAVKNVFPLGSSSIFTQNSSGCKPSALSKLQLPLAKSTFILMCSLWIINLTSWFLGSAFGRLLHHIRLKCAMHRIII